MIFNILKYSLRPNYLQKTFTNIPKNFRFQETSYSQLTLFQKQQSKPQISDDNWSQIYRLPIITLAAAFNRLKIYQAGVTTIGIPLSYALESSSLIPDQTAIVFTILGLTGLITLSLVSFVIKNLIGIIYINDKTDKLKLSYVDFWGQRKNIVLTIGDIIPPYEFPRKKLEFYQTVTTNEQNGIKLKLIQRFGEISNKATFLSIFGD